jgi:hypothetical protein
MVTPAKASLRLDGGRGGLSFMRMGFSGRAMLAIVVAILLWSAILPGLS